MTTKVIHRDDCRLCGSSKVEVVVHLEPVPLAEKYTATPEPAKQAEKFPIDLYFCHSCAHVQILDIISSDTLWDDYTYHSGQTRGIVDHFKEEAQEIISQYDPPSGSLVIDVGSNDGSLLRPFKEAGYSVLGIDPAKEIAEKATASGIPTIADFMTHEVGKKILREYGPAKVVTAFNVFAHAADMTGMAQAIRLLLDKDGVFVFEVQYLMDIVEKNLLGTIFHEHMSHHSLKPMMMFLERHDMELIDVKRVSIQKGSIIGFAKVKGGKRPVKASVNQLISLEAEKGLHSFQTIKTFESKLMRIRADVQKHILEWKSQNYGIAAFGAARSGPTFIAQFGLESAIEYIFDDHPQKVGKYSPPSGVKVFPTTELYTKNPKIIVILAWIHAKKIVSSNQKFLDQGGKFVVLCPDFQIIDNNSSYSNLL